jgi:hypothetical protein
MRKAVLTAREVIACCILVELMSGRRTNHTAF